MTPPNIKKRHGNIISSMMMNFDVARKALKVSQGSDGSAMAEHEKWMDSLAAKTRQFKEAWQELSVTFLKSDFLKGAIDVGTGFLSTINAIISSFGTLNTVMISIPIVEFIKNFDKLKDLGELKHAKDILHDLSHGYKDADGGVIGFFKEADDFDASDIKAITNAVSGLSGANAAAALSTIGLSDAQKIAILQSIGLTKEEAVQAVATANLSKAQVGATATTTGFAAATHGLKSAFVGLSAVIVAHPIMAAVAAITIATGLVVGVHKKLKEVKEEQRQFNSETANAANEEANSIIKSLAAYNEAKYAYETNIGSKEDLNNATMDLASALGIEKSAVDDLASSYEGLDAAIRNKANAELIENISKMSMGLNVAKDELLESADDVHLENGHYILVRDLSSPSRGNKEDPNLIYRNVLEEAGIEIGNWSSGGFGIKLPGTETLDNVLGTYSALIDILSALEGGITKGKYSREQLISSEPYMKISTAISKLYDEYGKYIEYVNNLNSVAAQIEFNEYVAENGFPKTQSEYDAMVSNMQSRSFLNGKAAGRFVGNKKQIDDSISSFLSNIPGLSEYYQQNVTKHNEELNSLLNYYKQEKERAKELGVDLNKVIYGNIDLNNRQVLEWTESSVDKYRSALESWGQNPDDMIGEFSTVFGGSNAYNGIEIAFSPILQTEDGPVLLSRNQVDRYISDIIDESNGDMSPGALFGLDNKGIEYNGVLIRGLLADIGDSAIKTGEAMHFVGENGSLSKAYNDLASAAANAGMSVTDLNNAIINGFFGSITNNIGHFSHNLGDLKFASEKSKELTSNISKIQSILSSQGPGKSLSIDDINTVATNGYISALEYANGVMQLNAEKVREITNAKIEEQIAINNTNKSLEQCEYIRNAKDIEAYKKKLKEVDSENGETEASIQENIDSLMAQNEAIANNCKQYDALSASMRQALSDYTNWINAQNSSDYGDMANDAISAVTRIQDTFDPDSELYGYTGTGKFQAAIEFIVPDHVDREDENAIQEYMEDFEKYLVFDENGAIGALNIDQFLEDAVTAGLMNYSDENGYTINGNRNMEDFERILNLSSGMTQAFFDELTARGGNFDWSDEIVESFGDIIVKGNEAAEVVRDFYKDSALSSDFVAVSDDINDLNKTIDLMNKYKSSISVGGVSEDEYEILENVNAVLQSCVAQKQMLEEGEGINIEGSGEGIVQDDTIPVSVEYEAVGVENLPDSFPDITRRVLYEFSPFSWLGNHNLNGTANLSGTANANGDWGAKGGNTLVGELGREIVVDPHSGKWYTVGDNGAEFVDIPSGSIVFNHVQSKSLLENGYVSGRAQALVSGTAMVTGGIKPFDKFFGSSDHKKGKRPKRGSPASKPSDKEDNDSENFDWIEILISRIERSINKLKNIASSTFKSLTTKLAASSDGIAQITEEITKQQEASKKYLEQAESVGLPDDLVKLVQNGAVDISKYDEETQKLISDYKEWYDKSLECSDAVDELHDSLAGLHEEQFNSTVTDYENQLSMLEHIANQYKSGMDLLEQKGYLASANEYLKMQDVERQKVELLRNELKDLQQSFDNAMASGEIEEYSEAWYNFQTSINNVKENISQSNNEIVALDKTIRQIQWDAFDRAQEKISSLIDETDFLIDVMSESDMFDDSGKATDRGMAVMGLHGQNYNSYMSKADKFAKEILSINEKISKDPANNDLIKRREELLELQRDSINAAEDEKQAISSMVEEGINKELESVKKLIDAYNDATNSTKNMYDYQNKISDKTSKIAEIEKQLAAYRNDTSDEAKSNIQKLRVDLEDAQKDLSESEYDQFVSDQRDLLDDLYEEYEEVLNQRLDNVDTLISDVITNINSNSENINSTIKNVAHDIGYTLTGEFSAIWGDSSSKYGEILSTYGDNFSEKATSIQHVLENIFEAIVNPGNFESNGIKSYSSGGLVNYTGLANVHGNSSNPEIVLNSGDSKNFIALRDVLREMGLNGITYNSYGNYDPARITYGVKKPSHDYVFPGSIGYHTDVKFGDIVIDHVDDYNDFVSKLQEDKNFEKLVQAMTVDRLAGKQSFSKYRNSWN